MSMMPARKHQQDGGPSVAAMVAPLRRVVSTDRGDEQVERVVRAVAYSWVIAGPDAHAKNFSLLLSGEHVRLAPLYDTFTRYCPICRANGAMCLQAM